MTVDALVWADSPQNCVAFYQKKLIFEAAQCFHGKANKMPKGKKLNPFDRTIKGRHMRNAAYAYQASAKRSKSASVFTFRIERAISILEEYLKEKLCDKKALCKLIQKQINALKKQIRYIRLTVATKKDQRAVVTITGYRFTKKHISPPVWSKMVRPGKYKITVSYGNLPPVKKEVSLAKHSKQTKVLLLPPAVPKKRMIPREPIPRPNPRPLSRKVEPKSPLRAKPPVKSNPRIRPLPVRRKTPKPKPLVRKKKPRKKPAQKQRFQWWAVVTMGLGGTLVLLGGTFATVGYLGGKSLESDILAIKTKAKGKELAAAEEMARQGDSAAHARERYDSAQSQLTLGWVLAGAGVAICVGGVLWYVLSRRPVNPTQKKANSSKLLQNDTKNFGSTVVFVKAN